MRLASAYAPPAESPQDPEILSTVDDILEVIALTLGLGVVSGGAVFAWRYLWSVFHSIIGAPTWKD